MPINSPWGKTSEGTSHHLAHHCADVAACFEVIGALPVVRTRMEKAAGRTLSAVDMSRLAMLAFLHDCGKLHPGFQAKGWPEGVWQDFKHGHVQEGAAIFAGVLESKIASHLHLDRLIAWDVDEHLLFSTLAHHGRPFKLEAAASQRWDVQPANGYDPLLAAKEIGAVMEDWFAPAFVDGAEPLPSEPDFQHLFCGLVTLADWLGSSPEIFDFAPYLDSDYMAKARKKAQRAVVDIGLDVSRLHESIMGRADFAVLTRGKSPRPPQRLVGDYPVEEQLVILESETGSGKTEAALWRFARLFEAGKVDSLYFSLPTRAAAKQIHRRVHKAMRNLFGADAPEAVLAVPGYLMSGETQGKALPDWKVRWADDDGQDERRNLARWAAENAKRYLAATVAVGTVDQAMLGALEVKHAHLRAATLSRSLLVIDEVHASDRYMTEVQSHLLKMHLGRGGYAMLMSATLGSVARERWLGPARRRSPPDFKDAVAAPYPAVWGKRDGTPRRVEKQEQQKRVATTLASWEPREAAARAITAARHGARVLVIRNTVTAALEVFAAVKEAGAQNLLWHVAGEPALHHSRFAPEDRKLLDDEVEKTLFPKLEERSSDGVIVIGTQTLEQSLDIDADILITDLCPVDVLLQRIGRLHRHDLPRPAAFEAPVCVILAPELGLARLAAPAFENGLGMLKDGGGVYRNLHACELTRRLILDRPEWAIPAMNRFLVESATHPDKIDALNAEMGAAWEHYWNTIYGKDIAETGAARHVALPVETPFAEVLFASDQEKIRTRLGAEGAIIRFSEPVRGPFGQEISSVTLPAHWSHGMEVDEPLTPSVDDDSVVNVAVEENYFHYDREGLKRGKRNDEGIQPS
ncbi:CRISPR-associated helicase/endonuclease Cas3 [soil metagenome]